MMKKFTFLFVFFFFTGFWLFSQKATTLLTKDFSNGIETDGWTLDGVTSQWSQSSTAKAGGTPPEAKLTYVNGTDTTRLISPPTDLTGISTVIFSFKHFLDDYSGTGYQIGVATRSGGGSWNNVWTVSPTDNIGPETKSLIVSNVDVGAPDFQICIFLSGDMYNFDYWFIDDIQLLSPDNNDLSLESIDISPYVAQGNVNISATVTNLGITNITSFDFNYQIDGNTPVTENVTGLNLATTDSYGYTFSTPWNATPGNHGLKVWVSNINGAGNDEDQNNDTSYLQMHVATQSVTKLPLYEEFTSSTCSPCATFNSQYFTTNFLDNNAGKFSIIKYQMDWPSPGDPYYTDEGGVRRGFYGINVIPTLFLDAQEGTYLNTTDLQNDLDNANTKPAFFDITAETQICGNTVYIDADITPYLDAANFTVHIAVVEKTTTGNVATNGETEFHYVMMKMLPDANGTIINFTSGVPETISQSFDMTSTNVEEMSDLAVVIFIQNNATKEIFQSAWAPVGISANFTPLNGAVGVLLDYNVNIEFSVPIRNIDDSPVTENDIYNFIHMSDPSKGDLTYTATINDSKTLITLNPDNNFSPYTYITVTVDPDMIENDANTSFKGGSVTFKTGTATNLNQINQDKIKIYPNPVSDVLSISGIDNCKVIISDISGKTVKEKVFNSEVKQINVKSFPSGTYFIKIISNNSQTVGKFIKQ